MLDIVEVKLFHCGGVVCERERHSDMTGGFSRCRMVGCRFGKVNADGNVSGQIFISYCPPRERLWHATH